MLPDQFQDVLLLAAGVISLAWFAARYWRRHSYGTSRAARWLGLAVLGGFWIYLMIALRLLFLPVQVPPGWPGMLTWEHVGLVLSHVNLVPLRFGGLFEANPRIILMELAGNILLTVPFGFGLPFVARVAPRGVPGLALWTGLGLEGTQLLMALANLPRRYGHSVDINDVLLNAAGVLLGYGLLRAGCRLCTWAARRALLPGSGVAAGLVELVREAGAQPVP